MPRSRTRSRARPAAAANRSPCPSRPARRLRTYRSMRLRAAAPCSASAHAPAALGHLRERPGRREGERVPVRGGEPSLGGRGGAVHEPGGVVEQGKLRLRERAPESGVGPHRAAPARRPHDVGRIAGAGEPCELLASPLARGALSLPHDHERREGADAGGRPQVGSDAPRGGKGCVKVAEHGKPHGLPQLELGVPRGDRRAERRVQPMGRQHACLPHERARPLREPRRARTARAQGRHEVARALSLRAGQQHVGPAPRERIAVGKVRARGQDIQLAADRPRHGLHGEAGRLEALATPVDAQVGVACRHKRRQILPARAERLHVGQGAPAQHEHGGHGQQQVGRQLLAQGVLQEGALSSDRPPHQPGHALRRRDGGSGAGGPVVGRAGGVQLGIGQQQVGGGELQAVVLKRPVGVARGGARGQHLASAPQQLVEHAGERGGSGRIEGRHVLHHREERCGIGRRQRGHDNAPVEVAQKAGALPVDPEHVVEREHHVGVLHGEPRLAEALGRHEEARHMALAQQARDEVGARVMAARCQMVGTMALAGRLLQEPGHRETLLSRRQRIGPVGFDHHSGEVSN